MAFAGFPENVFDIFELPGYAARMPRLRAEITPRLKELGAVLGARLETVFGIPMHPHVALHMRRTVNPPEETWVAFCRETRAYKPYVHFRAALNKNGMKFACFLEDDADDKAAFAGGLTRNASALLKSFKANNGIYSYDLIDSEGCPRLASSLTRGEVEAFADRLARVKSQHASFGIPVDRLSPSLRTADGVLRLAEESFRALMPLYDLGMKPGLRL